MKHSGGLVSNYFAFQKKVLSVYDKLVWYFLVTEVLCGPGGKNYTICNLLSEHF